MVIYNRNTSEEVCSIRHSGARSATGFWALMHAQLVQSRQLLQFSLIRAAPDVMRALRAWHYACARKKTGVQIPENGEEVVYFSAHVSPKMRRPLRGWATVLRPRPPSVTVE